KLHRWPRSCRVWQWHAVLRALLFQRSWFSKGFYHETQMVPPLWFPSSGWESTSLPLSSPIRLQSSRLVQVLLRAAYLNPVAKPPHGWRLCCLHFPAVPCSPKFPLSSVVVTYLSLRSEEHTSELQSRENLVCRLLLE